MVRVWAIRSPAPPPAAEHAAWVVWLAGMHPYAVRHHFPWTASAHHLTHSSASPGPVLLSAGGAAVTRAPSHLAQARTNASQPSRGPREGGAGERCHRHHRPPPGLPPAAAGRLGYAHRVAPPAGHRGWRGGGAAPSGPEGRGPGSGGGAQGVGGRAASACCCLLEHCASWAPAYPAIQASLGPFGLLAVFGYCLLLPLRSRAFLTRLITLGAPCVPAPAIAQASGQGAGITHAFHCAYLTTGDQVKVRGLSAACNH